MHYYKTLGIILKSEPYREADRVYTIYTKRYGKIRAMAKGVRKIKSKLAGHLEPFSLTNLMIVKGKMIDKIISARLIESFGNFYINPRCYLPVKDFVFRRWQAGLPKSESASMANGNRETLITTQTNEEKINVIREAIEKIAQGSYILEVVDVLTKEHHQDEKVFELLKETLKQLGSFSIIHNSRFIIQFLSFLGYKPELYQCVHCKKSSLKTGVTFSSKLGGLLCSQCKKLDQNSLIISEQGIEVLRKILLSERVNVTKEVEKIIDLFLKYRLEKKLKSEKFKNIDLD